MISLKKFLFSILPGPLQSALRQWWRKFFGFMCWAREWLPFISWLIIQCARHRKRAIIICRCGAMGDLICSLPICEVARQRHPRNLVVFVTAKIYRNLVLLSKTADAVYGSKHWVWPYAMPADFNVLGLVAAVYNPRTTDERFKNSGANCHLVDDLATSCGFSVACKQPRLCLNSELVNSARNRYGLKKEFVGDRIIIGINAGRTWPVRTWEPAKWRSLVKKINCLNGTIIIQFGLTLGNGLDELDNLEDVICLNNRLKSEDIAALVSICDLIIAIDSGPLHVAGAVGVPVIGLFGPVNPQFRLPFNSPAIGLVSDVPCLFCHNKTPIGHWITGCPNEIICMKTLDEQTVFDAVKSMLSSHPKQKTAAEQTAVI